MTGDDRSTRPDDVSLMARHGEFIPLTPPDSKDAPQTSVSAKCPDCGGDRLADISDVKTMMYDYGFTGEMADPGGRVLKFGNKSLRVSDMCNSCDARKIEEFLESRADELLRG